VEEEAVNEEAVNDVAVAEEAADEEMPSPPDEASTNGVPEADRDGHPSEGVTEEDRSQAGTRPEE
jgi:hypothetical protein